MSFRTKSPVAFVLVLVLAANVRAAETGYQKEVTVAHETRLDWTFVVSNQSVVDPPEEWLRGCESTKQRYELFAPPSSKRNAESRLSRN